MKKVSGKALILLLVALILADILIKQAVCAYLKPVGEVKVIEGFFYLTYVENEGMAFGLAAGARWIFVAFTLVVLGAIVWYVLKSRDKNSPLGLRLSVVMIAAGAVGNLIDRIRLGYVVDFLRFVFFGHSFAVFNFADILVTCGTALLCCYILFFDNKENLK